MVRIECLDGVREDDAERLDDAEVASHRVTPRGPTAVAAADREAGDRETAGRETAGRETAGRETAGRETADRETADRETGDREPDPPSLLVRVQVGLGSGERRVLGPAAATPAQADAMVLTAMGGIYQALAASCEDETDRSPTSGPHPGET